MSKKQEIQDEETTLSDTEDTEQERPAEGMPVEEELVEESSSLVNELEQQKEKFIRLLAEFENYKRRTARERLDIIKTAGQDIMADLLPVLDDVDRASEIIDKAQDVEAIRQGLVLISEKLKNMVAQKGLQPMEVKGQDFDAETMEAVTEIPAGDDMKGKVVDVIEKGYTLNEKIIRYAKVVVGK
ncbi:MAG: nucleotide exchange factor GrpE [Chitinophagales bacterium]